MSFVVSVVSAAVESVEGVVDVLSVLGVVEVPSVVGVCEVLSFAMPVPDSEPEGPVFVPLENANEWVWFGPAASDVVPVRPTTAPGPLVFCEPV
jgi:hypothetical protein